jgi:NAD(P)H-dependent FMN reductase
MKILVILSSTRETRGGERVAKWVMNSLEKHADLNAELVDLKDFKLPFYDLGTHPAALKTYDDSEVQAWADKIAEADGYIFLTAEYNHGVPAPLKNALDWLYGAWLNKTAGIVSYSSVASGGIHAADQLRLILGQLQMVTLGANVHIYDLNDAIDESGKLTNEAPQGSLDTLIKQLEVYTPLVTQARQALQN